MKIKLTGKPFSKASLPGLGIIGSILISVAVITTANAGSSGSNGITIADLVNDPLFEVVDANVTTPHQDRTPADPEWQQLMESNAPLKVNETYTESFDQSFFKTRLRPYTAVYSAPDILPGASFQIVDSTEGAKALVMETDGVQDGEYDFIEFSGMEFIEEACYSVTADYTVLSPGRLFKMGFGSTANCPYFLDIGGSTEGEKKTATGMFTANTPNGLGNDIHAAIILMIAGGNDPARVQIDSISITRIASKPAVENMVISGNTSVGSTLSVDYDFIGAEGAQEGASEIIWFTASDREGKNASYLTSTAGKKSITVTEAMTGSYVGVQIIPKTTTPEKNGIGEAQIAVTSNPVGTLVTYPDISLVNGGDSFTEDFETIDPDGNISFIKDESVTSYITDDPAMAISGKSLVIKSPGGIKGGMFDDITFAGGKSYTISFKYKFITAPNQFWLQFRASSQGYAADVNQMLGNYNTGSVYQFTSNPMELKNFTDYFLQVYDAGTPYEIVIDDLKIECIDTSKIDLTAEGSSYTEDFTVNRAAFVPNNPAVNATFVTGTNAIDGDSLRVTTTEAPFAGVLSNSFILDPGAKYKVTFDYKILSADSSLPMYCIFRRSSTYANDSACLIPGTPEVGVKYTFSHIYTLGEFDDYYVMIHASAGTTADYAIDNFKIEKYEEIIIPGEPETPSDGSTLDALATMGGKYTTNFADDAASLGFFSYDASHYQFITGENAINGKSLEMDYVAGKVNGTIYSFGTAGKLTGGASYRITFQYKLLTDLAPTDFHIGFRSDTGGGDLTTKPDFTGNVKGTVYTYTTDIALGNNPNYYLYWFNNNGTDGSSLVIDTLSIERIPEEPIVFIETPSDGSTPDDLLTAGGHYTANFADEGTALGFFSYDASHYRFITGASAISGKSLELDYAAGKVNGTIYSFGTAGKLAAKGKYRITFQYKLLSDLAPTDFHIGFRSDTGGGELTSKPDFTGNVKGIIYTYTTDITLGDNPNYYFYWFNNNCADGSSIVMDTLTIEHLAAEPVILEETPSDGSTPDNLAATGGTYTANFADEAALLGFFSYDASHYHFITGVDAINGKSLELDYAAGKVNGTIYSFGTAGKLAASGKYRITFQYKLMTDLAPTDFHIGFRSDTGGGELTSKPDFTGNVKGTIYTYTTEITLGDNPNYYFYWFNNNCAEGSSLVIDTLSIEHLATDPVILEETPSDGSTPDNLAAVGGTYTANFADEAALLGFFSYDASHYRFITGVDAICGKSLELDYASGKVNGTIYSFGTAGKLAASGKYRITFQYKLLTDLAPTDFHIGFRSDTGGGELTSKPDFTGNVKGTIYTYTTEITLGDNPNYYFYWFNNNCAEGSSLVIDTLSIGRIE